jgi:hypothetical protein
MIYVCDTERGTKSIGGLIRSGRVFVEKTPRFDDVETAVWKVLRGKIKPDLVVIDTLTTLATTARLDMVLDPAQAAGMSLWDNRGKMTASQRDWGEMSDLINRLLRMVREYDVPSVFVCHEGEREDPVTGMKKEGPDLNNAILKDVYALTDCLIRLSLSQDDAKDKDGTLYKAGTRVLRLASSAQAMAKIRIADDLPNPPSIIFEPTFTKFVEACGNEMPDNITLYGASGVGKTRFIGSAAAYFESLKTTPGAGQE